MKIIGCQHNLRKFCWTLKARDTDCLELNLSLKASAACNHLKRIWWCHAGNLPSFHHRNLIQCPHSGKILDETMLISHKVCVYKMIWSETHCSLRCQQESLIRIWRCHCNNVMKTGAENTGLDCDQAGTRLITQCWGRPLLYTVHTTVHSTLYRHQPGRDNVTTAALSQSNWTWTRSHLSPAVTASSCCSQCPDSAAAGADWSDVSNTEMMMILWYMIWRLQILSSTPLSWWWVGAD